MNLFAGFLAEPVFVSTLAVEVAEVLEREKKESSPEIVAAAIVHSMCSDVADQKERIRIFAELLLVVRAALRLRDEIDASTERI
jgi:hypothetical protein